MYPFAFASFFFYYFIILYFIGTQVMLLILLWLQQCNDSVRWLSLSSWKWQGSHVCSLWKENVRNTCVLCGNFMADTFLAMALGRLQRPEFSPGRGWKVFKVLHTSCCSELVRMSRWKMLAFCSLCLG